MSWKLPRRAPVFLSIFAFAFFCACKGWDADDGAVVPVKRGAVLLSESEAGKTAVFWPEEGLPVQLAPSADLPEPADLTVKGGKIWLALKLERLLLRLNDDFSIENQYALDFPPAALASGRGLFFAADAEANRLYFLDPEDDFAPAHSAELSASPQRLYYNSGKLYVLCEGGIAEVWREETLSRVAVLQTDGEIIDADFDRLYNLRIMVLRSDGQRVVGFIDANGDALRDYPATTSLLKIRYSPHFRQYYEREWEEDLVLGPDSTLGQTVPFEGVADFEIDFDYSEVYLLARDSLYAYNLKSARRRTGGPLTGSFFKAAFLYE